MDMKINLAASAALVAGIFALAPQAAEAQGPPAWVQERVEQERARADRQDRRGAEQRGQPGQAARGRAQAQGCAPGLGVARGTPAGAVLDGVFGRGGPAAHARPGCRGQDRARQGDRQRGAERRQDGGVLEEVRDRIERARRG
jgi:hypothetical protein